MKYEGLVHALDEDTYHSLPGLSSTGAKKILKSPAHYRHYVDTPQPTKAEFDLGSAVHAKVLGVGAGIIIYPDGKGDETFELDGEKFTDVLATNGATSTKLSEAFAERARAGGLIPVKRATARVVDLMTESVLSHKEARASFEGGASEVSMFATDPATGVDLRGRLDYLGTRISDLKTSSGDATESDFARVFFRLGYHVQFGHYSHIYEQITGDVLQWLWVVVETEAPYVTNVFALDRDEREMGIDKAREARETLARCMETGIWPARYKNSTHGPVGLLKAPMYAINEYIDSIERAAA